MAEQRTNDQISPKSGEEFTPEVLSKMSLEELEVVRKEITKRLKQRGSSRPVTNSNNWFDNKKNERDYLNLVRGAISDKLQESVLTFNDFIKEDVTEGEITNNNHNSYEPELDFLLDLQISILNDEDMNSLLDMVQNRMALISS